MFPLIMAAISMAQKKAQQQQADQQAFNQMNTQNLLPKKSDPHPFLRRHGEYNAAISTNTAARTSPTSSSNATLWWNTQRSWRPIS